MKSEQKKDKPQSLADVIAHSPSIDYQLKTTELAKEQIFLRKYTPLDGITGEEREEF